MRLVRPTSVPPPTPAAESLFGGVFPSPGGGGTQNLTGTGDSTLYVMGTGIQTSVGGTVTAVQHYVATSAQPSNVDYTVGLFLADPTGGLSSGAVLLTQQTATAPGAGLAGTWYSVTLSSPQTITAGQIVYPVVRTNRYAVSTQVFATSVSNGAHLTGVADAPAPFPNGAFQDSGAGTDPLVKPTNSSGAAFYGIDLLFTPS